MLRFQWRPASTLMFALFLAIVLPGAVFAGGLAPLFSTNELSADYAGESAFLLEAKAIEPLSLASADLDEDGVPDLVVGYGDGADGFFVVHRGNLEAIYPRSGDEAGPAFLPQAQVFKSLTRADHIATGDFDADGHFDIVAASTGGTLLELHRGDGTGRFGTVEIINLGGRLTAMAVGEVNRRDGHPDVVVGVDQPSGPKILVFESPLGALRGAPESIDAIDTVTSIELGNHDDDFMRDIAAVTESYRIDVKGRDRRLSLGAKQRAEVAAAIVNTEPVSVHAKNSAPLPFVELLDGEIVAHLTMRLNRDAFPDSIVIIDGQPDPIIIKTLSRATFTVDSTADDADFDTGDGVCDTDDSVGDGPCTLRAAIEQANASAGADTIEFDIPGPGPHVIQPTSRIPFITESVTIDGTTEPDFAGLPVVEVDGLLSPPTGDLHGLQIESAGNTAIRGLSVYRFENHGIVFRFVGGNIVEGCIAGTNAAGATGLGNGWGGIGFWSCSGNTVGGTTPQARNIASGNNSGIGCGPGDTVQGNWMGLDPTGTTAIPNYTGAGASGVGCTFGGVTAGAGNVVSGNDAFTNQGVGISAGTDALIHGNLVGTDPTGTIAIGNTGEGILIKFADGATIGGTSPAMRNIISGNYYGIVTESTAENALIQGNYIGTDITGTQDLGNDVVGVAIASGDGSTVGGAIAGAGNLVSGNYYGVSLGTSNNVAQGNLIGTDATGASPLPNESHGVLVGGSSNLVGGTNPGEANVIAFNDGHGVRVYPGTGHSILGNSIHSNTGINSYYIPGNGFGIELGYEDEIAINDPGDPDTGVNNLQNYPVLTTVTGGGATVNGSLNSIPSTQFDLHFYANTACDASGYGEGETFLGSDTVTTDAGGDVTFSSSLTTSVPVGRYVTATATAPDGSTSEFSACFQFTAIADLGITKDDGVTEVMPGGQVTYTIIATNAGPDDIPGAHVGDEFGEYLSCSWTCVAAGGATCATGPSTEDIEDIIYLPVGGTATYTAVCDIDHTALEFVENWAEVMVPDGADDPNEDNNEDDDTDTVLGIDYGDAPDPSFSTLWDSDGARHLMVGSLYLGASVDADADGQPTPAADGDDTDGTDDEDGVAFTSIVMTGETAFLDVTASAAGLLNVWIDLDRNGSWLGPGEQIVTDQPLSAGVNQLSFIVPADATPGVSYARFRLDSTGGLTPTGFASDGEVEDHVVDIRSSTLDIAETGQTTSYAAGDDGAFQMGMPWPVPRFVDNSDGTVTDELTGLMWTQDNVNPGPAPCGPGVTRDWFLSLSFVDCLNSNSYLGHDDWRMPNILELNSLIDFREFDHRPWWNSQGFTMTTNYRWWSSMTQPNGLGQAFTLSAVSSTSGVSKTAVSGTAVWPVRGGPEGGAVQLPATGQERCWDASYVEVPCAGTGQDGDHRAGAAWPSPRFEIDGDCVTDRLTGLTWTKDINPFGTRSWYGALDDALGLSLCGYDDWRLPSVLELRTLYHFDTGPGSAYGTLHDWWQSSGFVNMTNDPAWSGTSYAGNPAAAAWIMFVDYSKDIDDSLVVWPVRGNQQTDTADLSVLVADSADPVDPGDNITYTVAVSNLGPNPASDGVVTTTLPVGATFVGATGSGWSCGEVDLVVSCTMGSLAVGAAAPISIEITTPVLPGTMLSSNTVVDSLQDDPVGENNSAVETTIVRGYDFGDAPDPSYPTLLASNGAQHLLGGALFLGATVDVEPDGQPTPGADGDDLDGGDDEDGVVFAASLLAGADESFQVTASVAGMLNAWIDFNADGDWDDPGEQVFTDEPLVAGSNGLSVMIPLDAAVGTTCARFRFDSAGGLTPTGLAADGEVEDYTVVIDPSAELEVGISDSPDPVPEGGRLTYYVSVGNNGQLEATSVVLADTLPPEVSFVAASHPGCVEAGGVVTCDLATLAAGGSTMVEIEVDVAFGTTGTITNTAEVILNETDPVAGNNTDAEITTVVDEPTYIFSDGFETGNTTRWSLTSP